MATALEVPFPRVLELTRQFDQEKIDALDKRVEQLRAENETLRTKLAQSEKDTREFVAYFQREMSEKEKALAAVTEQLTCEQTQHRAQLRQNTEEHQNADAQAREVARAQEAQWQSQLKALQGELLSLEKYRDGRAAHEAEMAALRTTLAAAELAKEEGAAAAERAFFAEKARLQREAEAREAAIRSGAMVEARRGLSGESRRLHEENARLAGELRFQAATAASLEAAKAALAGEAAAARREAELAGQRDEEHARRGYARTKQMRALEQRVDSLQKALDESSAASPTGKEEAAAAAGRELRESLLDAAALRQLLVHKNRELRRLRRLSQYILDQRSDVETFFLEALQEARQKVVEERTAAHRRAVAENRARVRQAASSGIGVLAGQLPIVIDAAAAGDALPSRLPTDLDVKVKIGDLTWEDKERVLRMLFARINHVQGSVPAMPKHPLEQDTGLTARPAAKNLADRAQESGGSVRLGS